MNIAYENFSPSLHLQADLLSYEMHLPFLKASKEKNLSSLPLSLSNKA